MATAWHLARDHGLRVAVLERGWIGSGNTGRNTTVIRSNYLREQGIRFQDENLRLWTGLSAQLDFNLMVSHRGQIELLQTWGKVRDSRRRLHTMRMAGADYELLNADECYGLLPLLNRDPSMRLPILGGAWQGRAGTVRHDAVAWGYARAASTAGVDIVEGCEVTGMDCPGGVVQGVRTSAATSLRRWWASRSRATPVGWQQWRGCGFPLRRSLCRPLYPSRSSPCSTLW